MRSSDSKPIPLLDLYRTRAVGGSFAIMNYRPWGVAAMGWGDVIYLSHDELQADPAAILLANLAGFAKRRGDPDAGPQPRIDDKDKFYKKYRLSLGVSLTAPSTIRVTPMRKVYGLGSAVGSTGVRTLSLTAKPATLFRQLQRQFDRCR